jgi:hypothetical protein
MFSALTNLEAPSDNFRTGAIAGLVGGAAEVIWVSLSTTNAAAVARGVTATVSPQLAASGLGVAAGTAIHMLIALALGIAATIAIRSLMSADRPAYLEPLIVVGLLTAIWAFNFFILLPIVNPPFATLLPYGASLVSKVLFGIAAASVLMIGRPKPFPVSR